MSHAVIIRTGVANIASVEAALARCGLHTSVSTHASAVRDAPLVVVPGVGTFAAGMAAFRSHALDEELSRRIADGRPTLGICLGLQVLARSSEESPGVAGLGVLDADVSRFGDEVRVPQFGWNRVVPDPECELLAPGDAYFANSYRLTACPPGYRAAWADHGGRFVAAIERGCVLACQFHLELSGAWGAALLERWVARSMREVAAC